MKLGPGQAALGSRGIGGTPTRWWRLGGRARPGSAGGRVPGGVLVLGSPQEGARAAESTHPSQMSQSPRRTGGQPCTLRAQPWLTGPSRYLLVAESSSGAWRHQGLQTRSTGRQVAARGPSRQTLSVTWRTTALKRKARLAVSGQLFCLAVDIALAELISFPELFSLIFQAF